MGDIKLTVLHSCYYIFKLSKLRHICSFLLIIVYLIGVPTSNNNILIPYIMFILDPKLTELSTQ